MDFLLPTAAAGAGPLAPEPPAAEQERVEALAEFQETALRRALCFPALERLSYSTCSVYARENEEVVRAVLPEAQQKGFELADPFPGWHRQVPWSYGFSDRVDMPSLCNAHPPWAAPQRPAALRGMAGPGFMPASLASRAPLHRRGLPGLVEGHEKLVRCDPEEDGTDGFFVAVFERQRWPEGAPPPEAPLETQSNAGKTTGSKRAAAEGLQVGGGKKARTGSASAEAATKPVLVIATGHGQTKKKRKGGRRKPLV